MSALYTALAGLLVDILKALLDERQQTQSAQQVGQLAAERDAAIAAAAAQDRMAAAAAAAAGAADSLHAGTF